MPLAATRSGAGERIVLVHGFTQTGRSWARIAGNLAQDFEVVAIDAPGHGGSGHLRLDLPAGGLALGATGGRATYVGYSMGGRLALHLALARPDLVRRLVLLGASAGLNDPDERVARRAADDTLAARIEHGGVAAFLDAWLAQPLFAGLPDDPADRAERATNRAENLAANLRLAGTGSQDPLWDRLGELTMPVLVLAGERDVKFTALARRMVAAVGSSASLELIAGAGHAAHLERPDAFVAVLRTWLARH